VKYILMISGTQTDYDVISKFTPEQFQAMGERMHRFNQSLVDSGELVDTRGLAAPVHSKRVSLANGVPVVTDGPYAETQEVLISYWIVDVSGFDRAVEIAAGFADAPDPTGSFGNRHVDIRPVLGSADELD
jgi:hypothetical protein